MTDTGSAAGRRISVALLGPPEIMVDGAPLQVDTRKATALLAYLAVERRPVRRDRLVDLFWPEADAERGRGALRRTLSVLHHGLGGGLQITRDDVAAIGDAMVLDIGRFERLLGSLADHPHGAGSVCPACIPPLTEATDLYRADFLDGFGLRDAPDFDDWQGVHRERYRGRQSEALELLATALGSGGHLDTALRVVERWLDVDRWNEGAHRHAMVLREWTGNRSGALRQYEECERVLRTELGIAPAEETTRLRNDIAAGRLAAPPIARSRVITAVGFSPAVAPFVGREGELREMIAPLRGTGGRLWIIGGEAGMGKSRLLDETADEARALGFRIVKVQAYPGDADLPYGLIVHALRAARRVVPWDALPAHLLGEIARLLPELSDEHLGLPLARPLDSPGAKARFFAAVDHALFGDEPGAKVLLLIDDAHLADEPSLELLDYLVRRMTARPIRIAAAWREEALSEGHPLHRIARRRVSTTRVELLPLSSEAAAELASATHLTEDQVGRVLELSAGNPFVLTEYLAAGAMVADTAPPTVRALLASRLEDVDDRARSVLAAGSVIARPFDADLVSSIAELDERDVIAAVEDLLRRRILWEADPSSGGVDFSHALLRQHVYAHLSTARRRRLHRRTAEALAAQALGGWDSDAVEIASHFRQGGKPRAAADYLVVAGDRARALSAFADAAAGFEAAIELGHPDRTRLLEAAGDVLVLAGRYGRALEHYGEALHAREGRDAARLERKIGAVHARLWDWESAAHHLEKAWLLAGPRGPSSELALLAAERAVAAHRLGDEHRAAALAAESLGLAAQAGEPWIAVQAQNVLGLLAADRGDDETAEALLRHGLSAAGDEPEVEVALLNNLALLMGRTGRATEGVALVHEALRRNRELGDRHREAALRSNLADLYRSLGMDEPAMAEMKLSAALFAEVGRDPGSFEPEIWRLQEW